MTTLNEVLQQCSCTGAWGGTKISSLDQRNELGDTPLHTVCGWADLEAVKVLLAAGADVNAEGDGGATPLFNAIVGGDEKVVALLLSRGADRKRKIFGTTSAIDYAKSTAAKPEIIRLLEKK